METKPCSSGCQVISSQVVNSVMTASTDDSITLRATVDLVLEPNAPNALGGGLRDFPVTLLAIPGEGWKIHNIVPL